MKTIAVVSTLALTAVALAAPSQAQTPSNGRPYEQGATLPPASAAGDRGTVISVTPIVQQVVVPRQVCYDEQVAVQRPPSGAGALFGAIAGGAVGHAIGSGAGQAAATAIGAFSGAVVGNNVEAVGQPAQLHTARRCTTQNAYEDRTTAYNVVYEYAGRQYSAQMRQDPGPYVQVQVQVAPVGAMAQPPYPAPAVSPPQPVYVERPAYQGYPEPAYQTYPAPGPAVLLRNGPRVLLRTGLCAARAGPGGRCPHRLRRALRIRRLLRPRLARRPRALSARASRPACAIWSPPSSSAWRPSKPCSTSSA